MKYIILIFTITLLLIPSYGCARKKPVLYPNAHYKQTAPEQVQNDINTCMQEAREYVGESSRGETAVKGGVKGGLIGGAVGLGVGIVTGSPGSSAAAGAAGGSAGGAVGGAMDDSGNAVFRKFVNKCLKEKGYDPIGWE